MLADPLNSSQRSLLREDGRPVEWALSSGYVDYAAAEAAMEARVAAIAAGEAEEMVWLLEQEPTGATDELLYWFSRLSREKRFKRERLERREYLTQEHRVSLCSFALLSSKDANPENSEGTAHAS